MFLVCGVGTALGLVLDINNPLHDLTGAFGLLALPAAAILITTALRRSAGWTTAGSTLRWISNLTWISLLLFGVSLGVMALTVQLAGIKMDPRAGPTAHAPAGVIGIAGMTGRLVVAIHCLWAGVVAAKALRLSRTGNRV
jgi:hypothetical protein